MKIELINPARVLRAVISAKTIKSLEEVSDAIETGEFDLPGAKVFLHLTDGSIVDKEFESVTQASKWCAELGLVVISEEDV